MTTRNISAVRAITFDAGGGAPLSYTESGLTVTSLQNHLHMGDHDGDGSPDLESLLAAAASK